MRVIDLRSDTVTRPSAEMRRAMADAEVGDDVYGEDPTVNRLEAAAAARMGKERALFVPSGTMANQAALRVSTRHGDVVLASEGAHVLRYESGAAAALSGLQVKTLGTQGLIEEEEIEAAITPPDHHNAPVTLLTLENTHNASGGRVVPYDRLCRVVATARKHGLSAHLDGARIFNAEVATGRPAADWARPFDTVSFCLSKGLGAPVGSLVCGTAETIDRVHRIRKMLGGGMRQAGILAAAGLIALERNVSRLSEDHANARRLAEGLREIGLELLGFPETNIVLLAVDDATRFVAQAKACGVLLGAAARNRVRAVTHLDVSSTDIDEAVDRLRSIH